MASTDFPHSQVRHQDIHLVKVLCSRRAAKFILCVVFIVVVLIWTRYFMHNKSHEAELVRMKRMIATHGAACGDIRHIGGVMRGEVTETGFWDVCFDPEIGLHPLSCLVYSFGETDEWSFEQHMATKLRCQVIRFAPAQTQADASNSGQLIKSHSFALPGSFSNSSGKQNQLKKKTLYSILREFGHDKKKIDILKLSMAMNEEWEVLPQLLREGTLTRQVKQLLLTVHLDSTRADELIRWQAIIDWLGLQGFRLFNRNKGRLCDNCYELSWINDYI